MDHKRSGTFPSWAVRLNRPLVLMQTSRIEMCIPASRPNVRVAHQLSECNVAHFAVGVRRVGVPLAVKNELLASLEGNTCTLANTIHALDQSVLRIWASPRVNEDMSAMRVRASFQPSTHLPNAVGQGDDSRAGIFLPINSLVVGDYPNTVFKVDHLPSQSAKLTWTATSSLQGQEHPLKRSVAYGRSQEGLELRRGCSSIPTASYRFLVTSQRIVCNHLTLDCPLEDALHGRQCVTNRTRRQSAFPEVLFHISQVTFVNRCNSEVRAKDSQGPQKPVPVVSVGSRLLGFAFQKLVAETREGSTQPVLSTCSGSTAISENLGELAFRRTIIAVQIMELTCDLLAPEAAGSMEPGFVGREFGIGHWILLEKQGLRKYPMRQPGGSSRVYKGSMPSGWPRLFYQRGSVSQSNKMTYKVGATGFEPATSASRTQRSIQAELRPECPNLLS